jgi:hypothetical protein
MGAIPCEMQTHPAFDLDHRALGPRVRQAPMHEFSLEQTALNLLRRTLHAGAEPEVARDVVLQKLRSLFRRRAEDELRNAIAHAWARLRRQH